jgi:hypothetical protein
MTPNERLDRDLAIILFTAPLTLTLFAVLIIAGVINDYRTQHHKKNT